MKISITNWAKFQHYKTRRPPWIKLHRQLLESRHWFELTPDASKLLVECWLIASDNPDGTINCDLGDLAFRLRRDNDDILPTLQELALHGFIEMNKVDASNALADSLQPAIPETETETETKKKQTQRKRRVYSDEFEKIWKIHQRGPKAKAADEYRVALKNGVTHDDLVESLNVYQTTLRPPEFLGLHLFRWLKEERWEEEVVEQDAYKPTVLLNWSPFEEEA